MRHDIFPCLWLDGTALAVAEFYAKTFPGAGILDQSPLVVHVEVGGRTLMLLNGGPQFTPNPSLSFHFEVASLAQAESVWASLSDGGTVRMPFDQYPWAPHYGWISDRFGIDWQVFVSPQTLTPTMVPSLMFTQKQSGKAEEAIEFYTSLIPHSSVGTLSRYGPDQPAEREGTLTFAEFTLDGQPFRAMDSAQSHAFTFSVGGSLFLACETQDQIDTFWRALTNGGEESQCGWLVDRFGVSWQVVPQVLASLMEDPERAQRVVKAFLSMKKFDIATLMKA